MWTAHASGSATTTAVAAQLCPALPPVSQTVCSEKGSPHFILKKGRRFSVGDCALFQAGNFPPFIGIIRWFRSGQETCTKLGVNWLYRPADIKLTKGVILEAAPNEVFYSFHRDEISAESLLHPCKVAFLRKGVELPSEIPSFVCWRLYDITNKRLWWLTDTDYIDEHQDEIDQLLEKTRLDMHAAVQSGRRSPKPLTGPLPLKASSDSVQNSGTSLHTQAKGKKRGERGDQGSDSMKREHLSKADDGDSVVLRLDSMIKAEIAKISDKNGLTSNDAVEKLVQLLQLDRGEKKIDLACRVLLADIITATERNEYLVKFVQLKGIPILDDWLQEAHKGKNGDSCSLVEGDKSVEDLLLALLRALDKLPVNLSALQTCHIGKSVNNLRSHKNMDIQKKARCLVDTWKKRVDAEMTKIEMAKLNDAKTTGSSQTTPWPGKPGFSEASVGSKRAATTEMTSKGATNQSSIFKSLSLKNGHGDSTVRLNTVLSGSLKLSSTLSTSFGNKDSQTKTTITGGTAELQSPIMKDEKNCSSSQSQNISQSCPVDHAKPAVSSWKEDGRSSPVGSSNTSKSSVGASRHRRHSNSLVVSSTSGFQKENGFSKSYPLIQSTTSEKLLQSEHAVDKTADIPIPDYVSNHRLVVRLSNPARSPVRCASGGSTEDLSLTGNKSSSPGVSEKREHARKTKLNQGNCAPDSNTESNQIIGSGHANRMPFAPLDEEHGKSTDDTGKAADMLKASILLEPKSGKALEASSSSPKVIIGCCGTRDKNDMNGESVQYKEGDNADKVVSMHGVDKMPESNLAPVNDSPQRKPHSNDDNMTQPLGQPENNNVMTDPGKNESSEALLLLQDDIKQNGADCRNSKSMSSEEVKVTCEHSDQYHASSLQGKRLVSSLPSESKYDNVAADGCLSVSTLLVDSKDGVSGDDSANHSQENLNTVVLISEGLAAPDLQYANLVSAEDKSVDHVHEKDLECNELIVWSETVSDNISTAGRKSEKESVGELSSPLDKQKMEDEVLQTCTNHIPPDKAVCTEDVIRNVSKKTTTFISDVHYLEASEPKKQKSVDVAMKCKLESRGDTKDDSNLNEAVLGSVCSSVNPATEEDPGREVVQLQSVETAKREAPPLVPTIETEQGTKALAYDLCGNKLIEALKVSCSLETSSAVMVCQPSVSGKLEFDLNKGLSVGEGNVAEAVISSLPGRSSEIYLSHMSPFSLSPLPSSLPSHITVASPAKGPFVPPETLLKSKGERGWKGSAATSAFRPAEPRRVPEMMLGASDATSSKQCHPPLSIDLNVRDETAEDIADHSSAQQKEIKSVVLCSNDALVRSSGGLDVDLNRSDESTETGQLLASNSRRVEASVLRDFDLNGPGIDGIGAEQISLDRYSKGSNVPFLPMLRNNPNVTGILSSWFPPTNRYPAVALSSFLPDRRDQPYPVVAAPGSHCRGPVLPSSPTMTFSPAAPFPYARFHLGSSFPLASTSFSRGSTAYLDPMSGGACFPAMSTPLVGGAGHAAPYIRSSVVGLPEVTASGGSENSRKWGWQSLDLNSGPGSVDIDGREDIRQLAVAGPQYLSGEQARMYRTAVVGLKRKEPDGGWDTDRGSYKQHLWQ